MSENEAALEAIEKALTQKRGIAKVSVGAEWSDDHQPCANFAVHVRIGVAVQIVEFAWWWCGGETIAAARYAHESKTAMADFRRALEEHARFERDTFDEPDDQDPEFTHDDAE